MTENSRLLIAASAALSLASALPALAHTTISPNGPIPPRVNNAGIKSGPCGGYARGSGPVTQLKGGTQATIQFTEVIDHPGYFRLAWACGSAPSVTAPQSTFDANILVPMLQDTATGPVPHDFFQNFTVPDQNCPYATLQVIQYMTESNPPSLYYSCADVAITPSTGAPPGPTPTPTPTPTTTQSPPPAPAPTGAAPCP